MPNGERTTQTGDGEHGKTTIPLAGSTKNAAQLLHQNIKQDASRQGKCGAYPKRLLSVHTHRLSRYDLIGIDARPFVAPRQSVAHRQGLTNAEPIFSPKAEKRALLQVDTGQHTQRVGQTRFFSAAGRWPEKPHSPWCYSRYAWPLSPHPPTWRQPHLQHVLLHSGPHLAQTMRAFPNTSII